MKEQMKSSGIDWIGDIPESWKVKPIAYMTKSRSGGTPDRNNLLYWENGTIPWMSSGEVNKVNIYDTDEKITTLAVHHSSAKIISKNAVMVALNGQGKTKGMSAILRIDSACNQSLCAFSCNAGILYYEYLFCCFQTMYTYLRQMSGDDVRDGLAASYVKKQKIPVPKYKEQQAIADFLDKECAQIDSIAADLEKQIALLQQYKKSLITETVTKGLDKSVPMKDSGVEWIGEIPEHWNVLRVKDISKLQTGTTPPGNEGVNFDNDGIQWFTPADFNDGSIKLGLAEKSIDFDTIHRENIKAYPANTVLFVGIASIGKIGFSPNTCYSNQQITGIKPNNNKNGKYIAYSLLAGMDSIKDNALYTTVPIVNNAYLGNIKISFPPTNEQETITKYLDYATSSVDEIIGKKLEQLSTIQQHKKSLIYEYVTGKKRVKEVQ